jgi:hypothetical protein
LEEIESLVTEALMPVLSGAGQKQKGHGNENGEGGVETADIEKPPATSCRGLFMVRIVSFLATDYSLTLKTTPKVRGGPRVTYEAPASAP